jgi:hypothetical protein
MPSIITDQKAIEGGTFAVNFVFYDENSAAMTPNSLYWALTDIEGTIQKSAGAWQGIESVQSSIDIILKGNDLSVPAGKEYFDEIKLFLTLTGNYNSDLGNALPLHDVVEFSMLTLTAVDSS